ncbi:MAG: hypothetical protein P8010_22965 [Desulfosarcinaceae bacterium]
MDASSGLLTWQPSAPLTPFTEVENPYCAAPLQVNSPYRQVKGDSVLESIQIKDDRYFTGKFGFYVHSQGGVHYKARYIERTPAPYLVVESVDLKPFNDLLASF